MKQALHVVHMYTINGLLKLLALSYFPDQKDIAYFVFSCSPIVCSLTFVLTTVANTHHALSGPKSKFYPIPDISTNQAK